MTKKSWFTCRAKGETAEIDIYDEIGFWGVTAADFSKELKALGNPKEIILSINSPGGEVFDGLAIHNMLARHSAKVTVRIDGIAASMASVVAMVGDEILMPANAMMMIHDPRGGVYGTSEDMREWAAVLDKIKNSLIAAYAGKSGLSDEKIAELMAEETWLSAEEALELGFADRVTEPARLAANFDLSRFRNAPERLAAPTAPPEGKDRSMTDKTSEKTAEELAAAKAEAAEAKKRAETAEAERQELKAKAEEDAKKGEQAGAVAIAELCAAEGVPVMTAKLLKDGVSLEEAKARLADAKEIKAAVELAAKTSSAITAKTAEDMIAKGLTLAEAKAQLFEMMAKAPGGGTAAAPNASHTVRAAGAAEAAAGWDKQVTAVNARNGHKAA